MPRKIDTSWVTSKQAAAILTENSGHPVSMDYVRRMGLAGKFDTLQVDDRTKLYSRKDVESYRVAKRGDGSVRRTIRKDAREKAEKQTQKEAIA